MFFYGNSKLISFHTSQAASSGLYLLSAWIILFATWTRSHPSLWACIFGLIYFIKGHICYLGYPCPHKLQIECAISYISHLCYFARPTHWVVFLQRIQLLGENSSALRHSKVVTAEMLFNLTSDTHIVLTRKCKTSSLQKFHAVMAFGYPVSSAELCHGASCAALWLPLDLVLEDAMDGSQVSATSAVETITGK